MIGAAENQLLNVSYGLGRPAIAKEYNTEGRAITLEYAKFFAVFVYSPNAGEGLKRLDYRITVRTLEWFRELTYLIC